MKLKILFSTALILIIPLIAATEPNDKNSYYDINKEKDYNCIVEKISVISEGGCDHIYIETIYRDKNYRVYLCPFWYKGSYADYNRGDRIKVLGCLYDKSNPPLIIARMINRNGRELWLRNYEGKPLWDQNNSPETDRKKHPTGKK